MKISVIGSGYVGITTGLMFCELGHKVISVDTDEEKLESLRSGRLPIYEPGLEELLRQHLAKGNIEFTNQTKRAVEACEIIYITVGTPSNEDGSADLTYVREVAEAIGYYQSDYRIVVNKSTVPVGTGEKVKKWIESSQRLLWPVDVVSNPEFLREGSALYDAMNPDRIVIGADNSHAATVIKDLFRSIDCPKLITNLRTAELIKYSANAFLAMKISFINEIGRLCDACGADVNDVAFGIGLDQRIGQEFLKAGIGWGGSCFPKDVSSLIHMSEQAEVTPKILKAVREVNMDQIPYYINQLENRLGDVKGKTISILGISFKPDTDDIRGAPAIKVIKILLERGAAIKAYDPVAMKHLTALLPDVQACKDSEEVFEESDCVFLMTDWKEFLHFDWRKVYQKMRTPLIIDGRNVLNYKVLKEIGFHYYGMGNGNISSHCIYTLDNES